MYALIHVCGVSEQQQFLQVSFNGLLLGSTYPVRRSDADHSGGGDADAAILELQLHVPMGSHLQECILLLELYQSSAAPGGDALLLGAATVTGSQLRDLTRPSTSASSAMVHLISAMAKGRQRPTSSSERKTAGVVSVVSLQLRRSGDHDPFSSSSSSASLSPDDHSLSLVR